MQQRCCGWDSCSRHWTPLGFLKPLNILRFNRFIISNVVLQKSKEFSLFWFFSSYQFWNLFLILTLPLFIVLKLYLGHVFPLSSYVTYYIGTHNKDLFPLKYLFTLALSCMASLHFSLLKNWKKKTHQDSHT